MFARQRAEHLERQAEKAKAERAARGIPSRSIHKATYAGGTGDPAPKSEAYRDPALLEMARGRECTLADPYICDHYNQPNDTVAAHSNLGRHGKGGARKADDCYVAYLCACAHRWLDQSKAVAEAKEARFMMAHANTVLLWRLIAMDASEPERYRNAAKRALERLGATPLVEDV